MTAPYIEIKSESAATFIDDLQHTQFEDRVPEMATRFVFRGQGNSTWKLVLSAFRAGTILGYENREFARVAAEVPQPTWDQGNSECIALFEFLKLADEVGLDIPADHRWLRQWNPFNNVVGHSIGTHDWPPTELYEALAIAQHHGVPTRLLDFSYDPLIAAYFAAENPKAAAGEIAVWAVDLQLIALAAKDHLHSQIEIVTVPRARNKNLVAQKALFLLDRDVALGEYAAIENCIADHMRGGVLGGRVTEGSCALRKFSLSISECEKLVVLLRKLGIDRAHLMPSFDGVVHELLRRRGQAQHQFPLVGSTG